MQDTPETHYLYFMISRTPTRFGALLRRLGSLEYNHASVSFDAGLRQLYSFSRQQHNTLLIAKLMHETPDRFTLRKYPFVAVVLFRVPVSAEQYKAVREIVDAVRSDPEYIYNYLSVITYPVTRGFSTYKAFSCLEFVMLLLKKLGFPVDKPLYRYKPDELRTLLGDYTVFEGNLLDYLAQQNVPVSPGAGDGDGEPSADGKENDYFAPLNAHLIKESLLNAVRVVVRLPRRNRYF